jgi:hypothetical protein
VDTPTINHMNPDKPWSEAMKENRSCQRSYKVYSCWKIILPGYPRLQNLNVDWILSTHSRHWEIYSPPLHQTQFNQWTLPLLKSDITAVTFEDKAALFPFTMFLPAPVAASPSDITNWHILPWVKFTPTENKEAIFTSVPHKAPVPDGLPIQCLWQNYLAATKQFNSPFAILGTTGYHPTSWQQATTVSICKQGIPNDFIPKAYLPVALLNCLGRIL